VVAALVVVALLGALLGWLTGGSTVGLLRRGAESGDLVQEGGLGGILRADRLDNWVRALEVIRSAPLAGVGPGLYWSELPNVFGWLPGYGGYRDNALNHFLHVAAEQGIPGLLLFLVVWGAIGWTLWRRIERGPIVAGTFVSWCVLTVAFMTGPHLLHPEPQIVWWMLCGLALGCPAAAETGGETAPAPTEAMVDCDNDRIGARSGRSAARWMVVGVSLIAASGTTAAIVRAAGDGSLRATLVRRGLWQQGVMPSARDDVAGYADLWLAPVAELVLARGETIHGSLMVGHPDAAERPVRVEIEVEGETRRTIVIDATFREVPFDISPASPAPGMDDDRFVLVRVTTDRAWVPAETDPSNPDRRSLAVLWRMFAPRNAESEPAADTPISAPGP
jgi:hypothetical protein